MSVETAMRNVLSKAVRRVAARARWTIKRSWEQAKDGFHAVRRKGERVRDAAVNVSKGGLRAVRRPVRRADYRWRQTQEHWQHIRTEWQIEREIETIVRRDRLLVLGPWFSEVGFETLYWIPFLEWAKTAFRFDPTRAVAVSRGGVAAWYQNVAGRYIEIWDDLAPDEFARRNAARGIVKQHQRSDLDEAILDNVAARLGTRDFDVIHPSVMYRLFTLYWSGQRAMGFVDQHMKFRMMQTAEPLIDPALLPREYVAVKLYAARSMPDTPEIREKLRTLVAGLAGSQPVVLLETGLVLEDDHADFGFAAGSVISARRWMTPQNNLGVQTQIAAGARGFVGTCGSLAWLVPRLGVDTSALFVDPSWLHAHLPLALRAYHKLGGAGRFAAADLRALDTVYSERPLAHS